MKEFMEKVLIWVNVVLILAGISFIVIGILGENGVLVYVGIIFIVLNISPIWKYLRNRKQSDRGVK